MKIKELNKEKYIQYTEEINVHPLQAYSWGELKKPVWKALHLGMFENEKIQLVVSILIRKIPIVGKSFGYIPRGTFSAEILSKIIEYCEDKKLAFLLIDPDISLETGVKGQKLESVENVYKQIGMIKSGRQEQPIRTVVLDLTKSEDELLADMRSKHRQYIRKAERRGVEIKQGNDSDIEGFCRILQEIIDERGYKMHEIDYYKKVWELFRREGSAEMFVASMKDKVVGAYMLIFSKDGTYEMYGGCPERGKKHYANYALKWHSIKYSKDLGKKYYDQWGAELTQPGLVQFKEGFGGHVVEYPSQFVYVFSQSAYNFYKISRKFFNIIRNIRG